MFSSSKDLSVFFFIKLYRVGRKAEAKDAARGALKSPWWTLGCMYRVCKIYDSGFLVFKIIFFLLGYFFCQICLFRMLLI